MSFSNASSISTLEVSRFNNTELVFLVFGLILISLIATVGNICVFIAYYKSKSLQTASNWFLLSLAAADTWIGAVSVNFYTVYLAYGYWPFGRGTCEFWLSMDYWCSQASVLNLLVISVDRYLTIRIPLTYRTLRSNRRLKYVISFIWFLAFILWVPWIISYPYMVKKQAVPKNQCYIQFLSESTFLTVFTALAAYYIPVVIMVVLYSQIYALLKIRKQKANNLRGPFSNCSSVVPEISCVSVTQANSGHECFSDINNRDMTFQGLPKKKTYTKDHNRARKLLILVILAFAVTWLPYNVLAVISPFCSTCVTLPLWDFGYLFCYVNSLINPFCYAFGNRRFKKAFKSILSWRRTNSK